MKELVTCKCKTTYDKNKLNKAKAKKGLCDVVAKCGGKNKVTKEEAKAMLIQADSLYEEYIEIYDEIWESIPENGIESDEEKHDREMAMMIYNNFSIAPNNFTVGHSLLKFDTANANKDVVAYSDRDILLQAMPGQVCTYNHEQDIKIGAILNTSVYEPLRILVANVRFWESRPECEMLVKKIKDIYERTGELGFSFEIFTNTVECSTCGGKFPAQIEESRPGARDFERHYCDHLKTRMSPNSTTFRILRDLEPAGEAVVMDGDKPAFADSKTFIAAKSEDINLALEKLGEIEKILKGDK